MEGDKFTRCNNYLDESFTRERLDRFVANSNWTTLFKLKTVEVLIACHANHLPILLEIKNEIQSRKSKRKIFKFEAKWLLEVEGRDVIEGVWDKTVPKPNNVQSIHYKLVKCKEDLIHWSCWKKRDSKSDLAKHIEFLR